MGVGFVWGMYLMFGRRRDWLYIFQAGGFGVVDRRAKLSIMRGRLYVGRLYWMFGQGVSC